MSSGRVRVRGAHISRKGPARVLIKRLAIMFLAFSLAASYLYVIGNRQLFLDETQRFHLTAARCGAVSSLALSLIGFAFLLAAPASVTGTRRGGAIAGYAVAAVTSAAIAAVSFFIDALIR